MQYELCSQNGEVYNVQCTVHITILCFLWYLPQDQSLLVSPFPFHVLNSSRFCNRLVAELNHYMGYLLLHSHAWQNNTFVCFICLFLTRNSKTLHWPELLSFFFFISLFSTKLVFPIDFFKIKKNNMRCFSFTQTSETTKPLCTEQLHILALTTVQHNSWHCTVHCTAPK